jgi:hypothetical protein
LEDGMDIYAVVVKLAGPIMPVGETYEDERRLESLKELTKLVDKLISDIDEVGMLKNSPQYSRKKAGKYADKFLTDLGIEE